MTLEEGIEIQNNLLEAQSIDLELDEREAIKLGIEALKEVQRSRVNGYRFVAVKLPGETEEGTINVV